MTDVEIVIVIVQFVIMIVLILTLLFNRIDYKARMRPYIGFSDISVKDTDKPDTLEFQISVNNVGNIPAKNANLHGEFIITGEENTPFKCETKGSIFPSPVPEPYTWITVLEKIAKGAILDGSKSLQLDMIIDYYGSGRSRYWTKSSRKYDPFRGHWVNEEGDWK